MSQFAAISIWLLLFYVVAHTVSYLVLNVLAIRAVRHQLKGRSSLLDPLGISGFEPPISIIVPAYNEATTIVSTVRSAMQLAYPEFEIIVVNDGSKDATLDALVNAFNMREFPEAYRVRLASAKLRAIWHTPQHRNLRVVDKDNGGKADAINAGINAARYPLVCVVDADTILMRDSLLRIAQPFIDDPTTVACGGTVRIANGCRVEEGLLVEVGTPRNWLPLFQVMEYLRAFLFGRMGWSEVNGLLIISGAFSVMRKDIVIEAGGYLVDTIGEDMEMVLRLHRHMKASGKPYRITFVPDPIVWTEAPESIAILKNQRVRWQRGLCESLWKNRGLLTMKNGGVAGRIAFPFFLLFELASPVIEILGYLLTAWFVLTNQIDLVVAFWLAVTCIAFAMLLAAVTLLLEEISYHTYPRSADMLLLLGVAFLENFGYRQANAIWRLWGMAKWITGRPATWGAMHRSGAWQKK